MLSAAALCLGAVVFSGGAEQGVGLLENSSSSPHVHKVVFSAKQEAALKDFNLHVFNSHLQGMVKRMSGAVSQGIHGVEMAKKQIQKVEASAAAAKKQQSNKRTTTEVEDAMHKDQAAYDQTQKELATAQKELNLRSLATLQHHQLEHAEELHLKETEEGEYYTRNIIWDKQDMIRTTTLRTKEDLLERESAGEQQKLNSAVANMLKLEQSDEKKLHAAPHQKLVKAAVVAKKQDAMTRLTEKAALEGRAAGLDAALSAAIKQLPYSNKASIEHRVAQQLASSSPPPSARPTSPYSAKLPPAETSVQTALKMATTAAAEASLPQLASRQATAAWKTPAKPGNHISVFFLSC